MIEHCKYLRMLLTFNLVIKMVIRLREVTQKDEIMF